MTNQLSKICISNVYDPTGKEGIKQKYDIYAIPMIYVLDKDKKGNCQRCAGGETGGVLGNQLEMKQVNGFKLFRKLTEIKLK